MIRERILAWRALGHGNLFASPYLRDYSITRGQDMAKIKKVVITEFGDESKLAIVEADLPDPAA